MAIGPELDGAVVVDENDDSDDEPKDVAKHDRYVHSEYVKAKLARFTPRTNQKSYSKS